MNSEGEQTLQPNTKEPQEPIAVLDAKAASLLAFAALGIHNTIQLIPLGLPPQGLRLRALHLLYDIGHLLVLAWITLLAIALLQLIGPRRRWIQYALILALCIAPSPVVLAPDLRGFGFTLSAYAPLSLVRIVLPLAIALAPPLCAIIGARLLARPYYRWIGVGMAFTGVLCNFVHLRRDYLGIHAYLTLSSIVLAIASLAGARLPPKLHIFQRYRRPLAIAALAWAALSILLWPSHTIVTELFILESQIATPWLCRIRAAFLGWDTPVDPATIDAQTLLQPYFPKTLAQSAEYFQPRSADSTKRPPPPADTQQRYTLPSHPLVLFITIDSARADLFQGDTYREKLPNLYMLRDQGVYFSQARSPGPQTYVVLTSIFTGTYFSQQHWGEHPKGGRGKLWPHQDPSIGFPQILANAGVYTRHLAGEAVLMNEFGVGRGFFDEKHIGDTPYAADVINAAADTLKARRITGNLFLYAHLLDAHAPYDRGGKTGTAFERYIAELATVDEQIGRLWKTLHSLKLINRTVLIISADHGEAFGEHNAFRHGLNLYEELVHVPFIVVAPGLLPRVIDTPISLMDVGPTVLNLFGFNVPSAWMGESLLPFFSNPEHQPARPIFMESSRKMQAILFPDGLKLIRDKRRGSVELYDIHKDPQELWNLYDSGGSDAHNRLKLLHTFFGIHTLREGGYAPPYMR